MKEKRPLEIFLQLIKINALSQHEKPVAEYIHNFLRTLNLKPFFDRSNEKTGSDTGNLICRVGSGAKTTVNIGTINGGTATNVVPEKTLLTGEIRSSDDGVIEKQCGR